VFQDLIETAVSYTLFRGHGRVHLEVVTCGADAPKGHWRQGSSRRPSRRAASALGLQLWKIRLSPPTESSQEPPAPHVDAGATRFVVRSGFPETGCTSMSWLTTKPSMVSVIVAKSRLSGDNLPEFQPPESTSLLTTTHRLPSR